MVDLNRSFFFTGEKLIWISAHFFEEQFAIEDHYLIITMFRNGKSSNFTYCSHFHSFCIAVLDSQRVTGLREVAARHPRCGRR